MGTKKAACSVYEALTSMGKDCDHTGQKKHQRVSGAAKTETHSNSQNMIVRVISGNGGQACL
jgi:hypothetical protein